MSEGRHVRLHTSALLMESKHLVHWAPVSSAIPSHATPDRRGSGHQDPWCYRQHSAALLPPLLPPCVPGTEELQYSSRYQRCKKRPNWASLRGTSSLRRMLPSSLEKHHHSGEKITLKKDQRYCLLSLTAVCCSEALLPCFCLPAFWTHLKLGLCPQLQLSPSSCVKLPGFLFLCSCCSI